MALAVLTPGEEALLVGHEGGGAGSRQEGGDCHELEQTADRRQIPLTESGFERERRDVLQGEEAKVKGPFICDFQWRVISVNMHRSMD